MELNGQSFEAKALQPFGLELRPTSGVKLCVQPWVRESVASVVDAVQREGLLIIRNAVRTPHDNWEKIEPSSKNHSTTFPHVDRSGVISDGKPLDCIFWTVDGPQRSPTAFVKGEPLRDALVLERDVLAEIDLPTHDGPYMRSFVQRCRSLQAGVSAAVAVDFHRVVSSLHKLRFRAIPPDEQRTRSRFFAYLERILWPSISSVRSQKEIAAEAASLTACLETISQFRRRVLERIRPHVYEHRWAEKPDAAVLAWNNADETAEGRDFVAHFSVADESMPNQAMLNRARIHRGVIYGEQK